MDEVVAILMIVGAFVYMIGVIVRQLRREYSQRR